MEANWVGLIVPAVGVLLAAMCLAAGFRQGRRRRLVDSLPTSKTTGVFLGLVELKGTAEAELPLTSYLAGKRCVHYGWKVEEHWSRTVTETYTDSNGKTQTRTRHESGWRTVDEDGETIPFYLRDNAGVLLIQPEGANIEPTPLFDETCGRSEPLYYGKGPTHSISDSDHRRRFTEWGIPLHTPLYVMGQARERLDVVAAEIAQDPHCPLFLISTRSEEKISSGMKWAQWSWFIFGLLLATGGMIIRDLILERDPAVRWLWYVMTALGYLGVLGLVWCWMVFNSLVDLRNRVRQGWSQVEVQLKRRHDLIPNLVNVVQRFREHERELQRELAAMRGQMNATPPGVAGPDYGALLPCMIALRERYPELKADALFNQLEQNLVDTEQRIALARGYFNEIATHFNTRLEIIPERWVAQWAGMQPQALMEAEGFERAPLQVKLASR